MAREILGNMEAYLSAAQLGITLTSLGLGWAGEPFIARLLGPLFAAAGVESPKLIATLSFIVAFSLITFLHIVAGEQAPKILAIRRARQILLFCAWPMRIFYLVFRPFIHVINVSSSWVLKYVFRLKALPGHESAHTAEELRSGCRHSFGSFHDHRFIFHRTGAGDNANGMISADGDNTVRSGD
jgi:CBS domain containing-hemolysin-like protein